MYRSAFSWDGVIPLVQYVLWFSMFFGSVCSLVQYVLWFSMFFGSVCSLVQYVLWFSMKVVGVRSSIMTVYNCTEAKSMEEQRRTDIIERNLARSSCPSMHHLCDCNLALSKPLERR